MEAFALIDLCCPAALGRPEEIARAAKKAGLDSVVYVVDGFAALPEAGPIQAIADDHDLATLHPALSIRGEGYGYVVIVEDWATSPLLSALEALSEPSLIEQAVQEAGGCALPVSPRQGADGEVFRSVRGAHPLCEVGVVACVSGGSHLARDLDLEDAALNRRRVLAGTGPYGDMAELGRLATLMPVWPGDAAGLVEALNKGLGLALERGEARVERGQKKRRRRRKKSSHRGKGAASGSDSPAKSDEHAT